jgi:hypothetical protein
MPLTYPLTLPSNGVRNITWRKHSVVAEARYVFTGRRQVFPWPGQWWEADIVLPPMKRAAAEAWVSFLVGLNGKEGAFLLGDTANRLPRDGGLSAALISASPAIRNGGFETAGGGGADVFADWVEATEGTSVIVRDTSGFFSGAAACRFDVDGANSYVAVTSTAPLVAGKRYRLTLRAVAGAGGSIRIDALATVAVFTLTGSWEAYTVDFVATGTTLSIIRQSAASQSVWIDDVQLHSLDTYGGLVNGAGQTGDLQTDGWLASQTNILSAGDWIQLGSGATSKLYKVLQGANSNGSGEATLLLWPKLRSAPADNAVITVQNPVGVFALTENVTEWSIDEAKTYGLSFSAREVIT